MSAAGGGSGPFVVGLGSPHGDDQAGWLVVDRLAERGVDDARKVADGVGLLEALEGRDEVLVVDASAPAGHPGRVRRFAWPTPDLAASDLVSTHGLGLVEAFRMAEALGCAPRRATVVTIEAGRVAPGAPVSPAVARAVEALVRELGARGEGRPDRGDASSLPPCERDSGE